VNLYLLCVRVRLTCHLLSASCCCGPYLLQFSGMRHHTHLVQLALFIEDSSGCLTLFFSPMYGPTSLLQFQSLFIYTPCGEMPLPHSLTEHASCQSLLEAFPLCKHTGRGKASSSWLVYIEFIWGSAPPPLSSKVCHMGKLYSPLLWSSGCPALFAKCHFFQLLVYYSFFQFFSFCRAGVSLSRGLC
jgi:hypothetical protein